MKSHCQDKCGRTAQIHPVDVVTLPNADPMKSHCPDKCGSTAQINVVSLTSAGKGYQKLAKNIRETIEEIVSKKKNKFKNGRSISEETKQLYKDRLKEYRV